MEGKNSAGAICLKLNWVIPKIKRKLIKEPSSSCGPGRMRGVMKRRM
jgi:hypothetical protein